MKRGKLAHGGNFSGLIPDEAWHRCAVVSSYVLLSVLLLVFIYNSVLSSRRRAVGMSAVTVCAGQHRSYRGFVRPSIRQLLDH